jgi:hypothetical protein
VATKHFGAKRRDRSKDGAGEDTALRSLTEEDRAHLCMDAWEPSLLRKLLKAQDKLRRRRDR